uniref:Uncharacterized protein n=1 Tax=Loa loa TaxID=7209 RepID=A0A1I7VTP8_LOALO
MGETEERVRKSTPPPPYSPERPPPPYSTMINVRLDDININETKEKDENVPHLPCTPFSTGSITSTVHPRLISAPTTLISTSEGINPSSGFCKII